VTRIGSGLFTLPGDEKLDMRRDIGHFLQ